MIPTNLNVHNFLSYRDAEIDLSGIPFAIITGANGNGKSSLIDAMTYALFGEGRGRLADDLIRLGEKDMQVGLEFLLGETPYRVVRSRSRAGKGWCNFESYQDGKWKLIGGAGIAETNAKIQSVLNMDYRTLVNASLILQGNSDEFSRADPADRKRVLATILGLELYQAAADRKKAEVADLTVSVKTTLSLIDQKEAELTDRESAEAQVKASEGSVYQIEGNISSLETHLEDLQSQKEKLAKSSGEIDSLKERDVELQGEIARLIAEIPGLESRRLNLTTEINKADEIEAKANWFREAEADLGAIDQVGKKVSELSLRKADAHRLAQALESQRNQVVAEAESAYKAREAVLRAAESNKGCILRALRDQAKSLEGVPCAEELQNQCPAMGNALKAKTSIPNVEDELNQIQAHLSNLDDSEFGRTLSDRKAERESPNPHLEEAHQIQTEIEGLGFNPVKQAELMREVESLRTYPDLLQKIAVARAELKGIEDSLQEKRAAEGSAREKLRGVRAKIVDLAPVSAQINGLEADIASARADLTRERSSLKEAQETLASARARITQLNNLADEVTSVKALISEKQNTIQRLTAVQAMLGRNGVQAMLIERAIPAIEEKANGILQQVAPGFLIRLDTQRANVTGGVRETLDIIVSDEQGVRPYENYSGGERFRIDFALRIALSELIANRAGTRLETLIIDEGFGSQDVEGLARLLECLQAIAKDFRSILVVSHIEEMKDCFPVRIEVSKESGSSTLQIVR